MPALDNQLAEQLEVQLTQLSRDMDALERDINELAEFSGNREEHRQLGDSLRDEQRAMERQLDRLQLDISGLGHEEEPVAMQLSGLVERLRKRLGCLQRKFRAALLRYRGNVQGSAKKKREMLLSGAVTPAELRKRKVRTGNAVANAAVDLTSALRETVGMMEEEIEKSVANLGALDESSDLLRKTNREYGLLDGVLGQSKELIKMLEKADKTDRWLMLVGLVVFFAVAFNIVRKRVWIPGLSTLFSLLRYMLFGWSSAASKHEAPSESLTMVAAASVTSYIAASVVSIVSASTAAPILSSSSTLLAVTFVVPEISTSRVDDVSESPTMSDIESWSVVQSSDTLSLDGASVEEAASLDEQSLVAGIGQAAESELEEPAQLRNEIPKVAEISTTTTTINQEIKIQLPRPGADHRQPRTYTLPVERLVREEL
ncbi:Vesicle transport protein S20 [Coemansia asiatica]|nr:Vesicle transport protein S20 [Coemansia asiatica]